MRRPTLHLPSDLAEQLADADREIRRTRQAHAAAIQRRCDILKTARDRDDIFVTIP